MRRAAQNIEAYRADANRPAWHVVKHFGGTGDAFDPVPQCLRAYNAKRVKEEAEAENLRYRQRGLAAPAGDTADADDSGALPRRPPAPNAEAKSKSGKAGGRGAGYG